MPFVNRIGSGATRKFGFGAGMKPSEPTSVVGTAGNAQVSVAFTAPAIVGTGTISYTATSSPGSFTATGASSPLVVTGLSNGTAYTFTVTASNAFGSSTSAASTPVTPAAVPSTPNAPTATRGNAQVSLSWTAPANNGSAITDYVVQSSTDSVNWTTFADGTSTSTSATVTGLNNGTSYVFRIAATNGVGTSAFSSASTPVTPATIPGTPNAPTVTRGDTSVAVSWTAPSTGGSPITDYLVQYSSNSGSTWTTFADGTSATTSATVTGLTNGTSYVFRVAAVNSAGAGSYSPQSLPAIPAGVPATPSAPTPSAGNTAVSLSWTAPSDNGSAITDYKIYYATSAGGTYTLFSDTVSTTTSVTVTGLTNGTAYYFKIAAVNAVGDSALSAASTAATPVAPPSFPPDFTTANPCAGYSCVSCSSAAGCCYKGTILGCAATQFGCPYGGWFDTYGDCNCSCPATFAGFAYCAGIADGC